MPHADEGAGDVVPLAAVAADDGPTTSTAPDPLPSGPAHRSMLRMVVVFVNSVIGTGIIGVPYTLKRAGFGAGLALMLIASVMAHYSLQLQVGAGVAVHAHTYERACEKCFGRRGYYTAACCLLVFEYGCCVSFLVVLTDSASHAAAQLWPSVGMHPRAVHAGCLLATAPALLVLCLKRDVGQLVHASWLKAALVSALALFVGAQYLQAAVHHATAFPHGTPPLVSGGLGSAFGTIAFAFTNNGTAFLLFDSLERACLSRWSRLSSYGIGISLVCTVIFAIAGHLTFGAAVSDNLLNDYPAGQWILVMRVAYTCMLLLTLPGSFMVLRHVCNELAFSHRADFAPAHANSTRRHLLLTLPIFGAMCLPVLLRVRLGFVMSLTGGVGAALLSYVLPPAMWIKARSRHYPSAAWFGNRSSAMRAAWDMLPAVAMLVVGSLVAVATTVQVLVCEGAVVTHKQLHYAPLSQAGNGNSRLCYAD